MASSSKLDIRIVVNIANIVKFAIAILLTTIGSASDFEVSVSDFIDELFTNDSLAGS